ncbi:MAG: hypothetical protein J6C38_00030 [Oscillospiraceae bacterium]|nr:hypothetical protein [Oscillospiraceae bacterium]
MNNSIKRITGSIMAAAIFAASIAASSTASASYIDGDREVDYYSFKIEANMYLDEWSPSTTSGITKRIADRNWVISVNSVSTSQYSIRYGVMRFSDPNDPTNNLGGTEGIAYDTVLRGTGNSGGRYFSNKFKGSNIHMYASQSVNAPTGTIIRSSGQWSPDAPY